MGLRRRAGCHVVSIRSLPIRDAAAISVGHAARGPHGRSTDTFARVNATWIGAGDLGAPGGTKWHASTDAL